MKKPEDYLNGKYSFSRTELHTIIHTVQAEAHNEAFKEAFNAGISACQKEVVKRQFIILVSRFEDLKI